MSQTTIVPGIYQHYKGPKYRVFEVARHSESEEVLVVYRALYGDFGLWVRPLSMFTQTLDFEGQTVARFSLIEQLDNPIAQAS